MIQFGAEYFGGKRSWGLPVVVVYREGTVYVQSEDGHPLLSAPLKKCVISPPLGKTLRTIRFPNGAQCETKEFDAVAKLEKCDGRTHIMSFVHFLESHWRMAGVCLISLIICVVVLSRSAIPFASRKIAYSMPPDFMDKVSRSTIKVLDEKFLDPSQLDEDRRRKLKEQFKMYFAGDASGLSYSLVFRKSSALGANAFALPSGRIIMTDELVELSRDDRELIAVMAHEAAHVRYRHGLRGVFQDAGIFLLISALVGDVASFTSIASSLPTLLARSNYSREFEREADEAAGIFLIEQGWSTQPYQDILVRMTEDAPNFTGEAVISSHPLTRERIMNLKRLEERYISFLPSRDFESVTSSANSMSPPMGSP